MPFESPLARLDRAIVLVVDMQERMMKAIHDRESVVAAADRLLRGAAALGAPVLATEQYPDGLGATVAEVSACWPASTAVMPKVNCSCWAEEAVRLRLRETGRTDVLLCGVEAHVCIQQTALDLNVAGFRAFVPADAVGSRRPEEKAIALERMRHAGVAVTTVEALLFELVRRCDAPAFRQIIQIVK